MACRKCGRPGDRKICRACLSDLKGRVQLATLVILAVSVVSVGAAAILKAMV